ncbi:MAG: CoA ester lyase [Dehalococcoidia bacterium]|nr:CoA ester lyase [Dehalococcoidia bacterium]
MTSEKRPLPLMRSVLTVPVIVGRFIEKAPGSGADVICLDLEDSIPPAQKAAARAPAAGAIAAMPRSGFTLLVRLNALTTGLLEDDLIAVVRPGLDGVIVSKTNSAADMRRVDHYLAVLEREREMAPGSVAIIPLIETALGVRNCYEICEASPRVSGAVFGAEDFATDIGIQRSRGGEEVRWARTQVAIACHAAAIVPIDTPDPDYTDEAHLEREMVLARSLGYQGKLCIHPTQVAIANRVFRPSDNEVAEARVIVEAFERDGLAQGRAAIPLEGRMVDTPIYWRAKRLLEWASGLK